MKIICLGCGHKVDLGDAYDDYAGLVKCVACGVTLEIRTEEGNLRTVACAPQPTAVTPAVEVAHPRLQSGHAPPQE